jgi:hypothetical protein
MMEWTLPAERAAELSRLRYPVSASGGQNVYAYIQGAPWRGFFAKYPESNHLHKKMLRVHDKVMDALEYVTAAEHAAMLDDLWMGQCNWRLRGGDGNYAAAYRMNGAVPDQAGLDARGTEPDVTALRLTNTFLDTGVSVALRQPADLWRFPVETLSNAEAGLERVYQCSCTLLFWPLALAPDESWQSQLTFMLDRGD